MEELEKITKLKFPKDLSSNNANQYMKLVCMKYKLECPFLETTARLLDKVITFLFPSLFWAYCPLFVIFPFV